MPRSRLKLVRVVFAVVMLAAFLLVFIDLRSSAPTSSIRQLASTQFVPALLGFGTGAAGATALVVILVVTLLLGRVYCSAVCPLGILQDAISRIRRWLSRRRPLLPYRRAQVWVRRGFFWATVAGIATGWFGFTLSLLDPYSIFGRIAADLFRPLVGHLNNLLAAAGTAAGVTLVNRVDVHWAAVGALAFPLLGLGLVAVMSARRGRLYCNTVCPVGTLLGMISARGAFRLTIDQTTCVKCGDCLRVCKAQCIDLRAGTIDASRCVACYNCIGACDEHGIRYRFSWKRTPKLAPPPTPVAIERNARCGTGVTPVGLGKPDPSSPLAPAQMETPRALPPAAPSPSTEPELAHPVDPQRRAFLSELGIAFTTAVGATALLNAARASESDDEPFETDGGRRRHRRQERRRNNESRAIAPPGAHSVDQLLEHCTACHLCITACPTHVLQPAFLEYGWEGMMKPRLDYTRSYCLFDCQRCSDVCPDGALTPLTLALKHGAKIGVAKLDLDKCIVKTKGTDCAACSEHCPTKAVDTKPYGDNLRVPWVHGESCIGCGACEYACPVEPKAIRVTGHQQHKFIRERPVEKAEAPTPAGDFPF